VPHCRNAVATSERGRNLGAKLTPRTGRVRSCKPVRTPDFELPVAMSRAPATRIGLARKRTYVLGVANPYSRQYSRTSARHHGHARAAMILGARAALAVAGIMPARKSCPIGR
jgi:hypothetical protein